MDLQIITVLRRRGIRLLPLLALTLASCSSTEQPVVVEYYPVSYRQLPPEPVYSRITLSHLPQPVGTKRAVSAPMLSPVLMVDLPHSDLREAVEALAQALGYRTEYPRGLLSRPVSIKMEGRIDQLIREVEKQAQVIIVLNHDERRVIVSPEPSSIDDEMGS